MRNSFFPAHLVLSALVLAAGCSGQTGQTGPNTRLAEKYLLSTEPEGARSVCDLRASAGADEQVVVVGRIGGAKDPWVEGVAAFLITDTSLVPCNERPGDNCPTPWDYCCDLDVLKDSKVTVKFLDDDGKLLKTGAQEMLNLEELQTVVIRGRAERDESGKVTVFADGVFVRT